MRPDTEAGPPVRRRQRLQWHQPARTGQLVTCPVEDGFESFVAVHSPTILGISYACTATSRRLRRVGLHEMQVDPRQGLHEGVGQ